jgi:hypothetical protein
MVKTRWLVTFVAKCRVLRMSHAKSIEAYDTKSDYWEDSSAIARSYGCGRMGKSHCRNSDKAVGTIDCNPFNSQNRLSIQLFFGQSCLSIQDFQC